LSTTEASDAPTILEEIKQSRPFRSPSHEAYVTLLRTADESRRYVTRLLEAEGVTLQQYNVLRILRGAGPEGLPTLEIGERMVERQPGVTRLVDRLVKKGLVDRNRGAKDRRVVRCSITDPGLDLLDDLDGIVERADGCIVGALGEERLTELVTTLDALRAALRDGFDD